MPPLSASAYSRYIDMANTSTDTQTVQFARAMAAMILDRSKNSVVVVRRDDLIQSSFQLTPEEKKRVMTPAEYLDDLEDRITRLAKVAKNLSRTSTPKALEAIEKKIEELEEEYWSIVSMTGDIVVPEGSA